MSGATGTAMRVVIVDDEPLARASLLALVVGDPEVRVVGEAGNGPKAVAVIAELRPDVVLLDVCMPGMDGFDVLDALEPEAAPDVVFVTAHDDYAVRAFEVHAVDYLLKPVSRERFAVAMTRAKERHRRGAGLTGELQRLRRDGSLGRQPDRAAGDRGPGHRRRLAIRSAGRVRLVRCERIDWIEAADYYSRLHVGDSSYLIRESMKSLEAELDPRRFVRIHRSTIVNVDRVREVRSRLHGGHTVVLEDGTTLRLARSRREVLETLVSSR